MAENDSDKPKVKIPEIFLHPVQAADAREQASEYLGFARGIDIRADDGEVFELANPSYIDDEAQDRYDALQMDMESWDRHPDVFNDDARKELTDKMREAFVGADVEPASKEMVNDLIDRAVQVFVDYALANAGALVRRGNFMVPHRKNGERLEPYNTQLMKALFGERYERARAAGIRSNDVAVHWTVMNRVVAERMVIDSKSSDRAGDLVPVPDGDRVGPESVPPPVDSPVASGDDEQPRAARPVGAST